MLPFGGHAMTGTLTHFDAAGRAAMVDVSAKPETDPQRHRPGAGGDAGRRPWR